MFPLNLYARVRILDAQFAHETAGAASTRHSLRPLIFMARTLCIYLGHRPRDRGGVRAVIARSPYVEASILHLPGQVDCCARNDVRRYRAKVFEKPRRSERSIHLTIFWRCSRPHFSSRTNSERCSGNEPSTVLAENSLIKGLAMLIRSDLVGVQGGAAEAAPAIPAARLPTLRLSGLLLLIGP